MTVDTNAGIGTDVLMTTETLAAHLEDEAITVVEVDEDTSAFGRGHIPGAVSLDWTQSRASRRGEPSKVVAAAQNRELFAMS